MAEFFREYSRMIFLSLGGVFAFLFFIPFRLRLGMSLLRVAAAIILLLAVGFLSARYLFPYLEAFGKVENMAGYRMYGVVLFMPFYCFLTAKLFRVSPPGFSDVAAVCIVVVLMFSRLDCFVKNCCIGTYFFNTKFRWPIREIELIVHALFLAKFVPKLNQGKTEGKLYPLYMIIYGVMRFVLEFLRVEGDRIGESVFHLAHLWSALSILFGAALLHLQKRTFIKRELKNDE